MPSCMRAPPDSMKPTTGAPARPASSQHAHDRVGVRRAERAADEATVLRVAGDRAGRRRGRPRRRRRRRRCCAWPGARGTTSERITLQRAGVAEQLEPLQRVELDGSSARLARARTLVAAVALASCACRLEAQHGVVAAEPERVRHRDRARSPFGERPRLVAGRSRGRGPRRAARSRASAARRASRSASSVAIASTAPAAPSRWPIADLVERHGHAVAACSPSAVLIASVSARSLSGVEVPCALT